MTQLDHSGMAELGVTAWLNRDGTPRPWWDIWTPMGHPDPNGTAIPSKAHLLPGQEGAIEVAEARDVLRGAR